MKHLYLMSIIISFGITEAMEIVRCKPSWKRIAKEAKQALKLEEKKEADAKKLVEQKNSYVSALINEPTPIMCQSLLRKQSSKNNTTLAAQTGLEKPKNKTILSPSGTYAAYITTDYLNGKLRTIIEFFDIKSCQKISEVSQFAKLKKIAWAQDNQRCIINFMGLEIIIFDIKTSNKIVLSTNGYASVYRHSFNEVLSLILLRARTKEDVGNLLLYDASNGNKIAELQNVTNNKYNFCSVWSNGGEYLAHTMDCLTIVDAEETGSAIGEFPEIKNAKMLLWSPDDSMIALKFKDQRHITIGRMDWMARQVNCNGLVHNFAWSPDSTKIAVVAGQNIEVWEPATGEQPVCTLFAKLNHRRAKCIKMLWNLQSTKIILFIPQRRKSHVWDLAAGKIKVIPSACGRIFGLYWNTSGLSMVCGNESMVPAYYWIPNEELEIDN